MKMATHKACAVLLASFLPVSVEGSQLVANTVETPVARVVGLIERLKTKIEEDGEKDQESYNEYAHWCETTLAKKASDIKDEKNTIEESNALMKKLKAEIAVHEVQIKQIEKLIKQNKQSQTDTSAMRENQHNEYVAFKTEAEQSLGALDAAIKALSGAGSGKKGFLQDAQVLSVVAGVGKALRTNIVAGSLSDDDMALVKDFVEKPEQFVSAKPFAAVQVQQNPFGDYAPKSGQIQGILKGMFDTFTTDLDKANKEEAEQLESFEELMATKKQELESLENNLQSHTLDSTSKAKTVSETKQLLDDTYAQLDADEKFFEKTKDGCRSKAKAWSERVRLRTEELHSMVTAIDILGNDGAQKTFESSGTTLLQVTSGERAKARDNVFKKLTSLAKEFRSTALVQIAANLRSGGHFDKVIAAIDKMITLLREEEQDDIAHRDRCEASLNKNKNAKEDLAAKQEKLGRESESLERQKGKAKESLDTTNTEIEELEGEMKQLLEFRNEENAAHKQALKDDSDAVELMGHAIEVLSDFYRKNKIPLQLVQKQSPEYSEDPNKPPSTSFDGKYGERKSETGGIIAILTMLKEDTEKEIAESTAAEKEALDEYFAQKKAMDKSMKALKTTRAALESEVSDVAAEVETKAESVAQATADAEGEEKVAASLDKDCAWVDTHFDERRNSRKAEMDGLVEAKNYLAGVEAGSEIA